MTRRDGRKKPCHNCGATISVYEAWSAWMRNNPRLDSVQQCVNISDCDMIIHKYDQRITPSRISVPVMYMMLIEIKTHSWQPDKWQRELLAIHDDCVRTKAFATQRDERGHFAVGHDDNQRKVVSLYHAQPVTVMHYGCHILTMDDETPGTSAIMIWEDPRGHNKQRITVGQLEQLLTFQINPDSLQPMLLARHKRRRDEPALFDLGVHELDNDDDEL